MNDRSTTPVPSWLHALAVLTVLLTLPLLFLGAGVTSHGVGMIDPRGFRLPWDIVNGLLENSGLAWRLERADGIDQSAARADPSRGTIEQLALERGTFGDGSRTGASDVCRSAERRGAWLTRATRLSVKRPAMRPVASWR